MLVRVLYAYSATAETELSVQPDERLTLIAPAREGWVQVATLDGQSEGFVPANYVRQDVTQDEAADDDDDDDSSVCSRGSFTTVAPARAAQPNIVAATALGKQLSGRLAAATSPKVAAQGITPSACAGGLYEPFGDLKIDATQPPALPPRAACRPHGGYGSCLTRTGGRARPKVGCESCGLRRCRRCWLRLTPSKRCCGQARRRVWASLCTTRTGAR